MTDSPRKVRIHVTGQPTLIENLNLTVRSYNSLKRYGVNTTTKLKTWCRCDLLDMRNFGIVSAQEVIDALKEYSGEDIKPCDHGKKTDDAA